MAGCGDANDRVGSKRNPTLRSRLPACRFQLRRRVRLPRALVLRRCAASLRGRAVGIVWFPDECGAIWLFVVSLAFVNGGGMLTSLRRSTTRVCNRPVCYGQCAHERGHKVVWVCGCASQAEEERIRASACADEV
jgi:hypothetical protein